MMGQPGDVHIIALSLRIYRLLLVAYPARFRQEYGSHMSQLFRDCCLRTVQLSGTNGMLKLWAITLLDLVQSVISEHRQKQGFMTRSKFIRVSGWSLIAGAGAFLPGAIGMLLWDTQYALPSWDAPLMQVMAFAVFSAPLLFAVGLMGLRARYGSVVGTLGGGVLLFGAVLGVLLLIIGILGQMLASTDSASEDYYYVWAWGVFALFSGLFCFGVLALMKKPMSRWNGLPLIASLWLPILLLVGLIGNAPFESLLTFAIAGLVLMTVAMILLGYILQGDVAEAAPAPA